MWITYKANKIWSNIEQCITDTEIEILQAQADKSQKAWITYDIIKLIKERRKQKNMQTEEGIRKY